MRDAMQSLGGDPKKINPLLPAELVIDHSVQVDANSARRARLRSTPISNFSATSSATPSCAGDRRRSEFQVVPPDTGICHQVNLEYLARVVSIRRTTASAGAYPDSLVGTDSHTTMVNGSGVFGWGVGGIEAEAAMLGQPLSMLIPEVVGFKLHGCRKARRPPIWC
jgi:aconitate hydratase